MVQNAVHEGNSHFEVQVVFTHPSFCQFHIFDLFVAFLFLLPYFSVRGIHFLLFPHKYPLDIHTNSILFMQVSKPLLNFYALD